MKKGNLLIIEDEIILAQNLARMLETKAEHIFTANDGMTGIKILQNEQVHCVICDIFMPEMTGLEVIKYIRGLGNCVPFIFFTAYAIDEIRAEIFGYENVQFIVKPDIEGLLNETDLFFTMLAGQKQESSS